MRQTRLSHGPNKQDEAMTPPAPSRPDAAPFNEVMSLQQSIGNAAVGHLLGGRERASGEVATPVDQFTQGLITAQLGRGQAMDASLKGDMSGVVPGPVGGVRIHRRPESDALTRRMSATAFTQGRDVFLRSDRDPASAAGRATLAHELTHVAQGSVGPGAVLREPEPLPMGGGDKAKEPEHVPGAVAKMTIQGNEVDGGSRVPGHAGEVEFESIQLGSSMPGNNLAGKGAGESTDVTCYRLLDPVSPRFFEAAAKGYRIDSARFQVIRRREDGTIEDGFSIEFKNGQISNLVFGGEADGRPSESLTFSFEKPK